MPGYKTHSIHGELLFKDINSKIMLSKDDFKTFCMGPDILALSDYRIFDKEHEYKVKSFYLNLLKLIKDNKLQDNSEVISFLYGHLDHLVLDSLMHPLIYYMTSNSLDHTISEHKMDNYILNKYNIDDNNYYTKTNIDDPNLKTILDILYKTVYGTRYESIKYNIGLKSIALYDKQVRHVKLLSKTCILHRKNNSKTLKLLNLDHDIWLNPETKEKYDSSFEDLWDLSHDVFLTTVDEVNRYLYKDGVLDCKLINENISYNTGLPCEMGQSKQYIRKRKNN